MSDVLLACEDFVLEMVNRWVVNSPNAAAVRDDSGRSTTPHCGSAAAAVAAGLQASQLGVGDRVAVLMARSIKWMTVLRGVMRAGCVYVPLSPANPASRNTEMVRRSRALPGNRTRLAGPVGGDGFDPPLLLHSHISAQALQPQRGKQPEARASRMDARAARTDA